MCEKGEHAYPEQQAAMHAAVTKDQSHDIVIVQS